MLAAPGWSGARPAAIILAAVLAVTACSGDEDTAPDPTVATTTTVVPTPRESDGTLVIGALLPVGDTLIGTSLTDAVFASQAAINDAGGVLGNDVEVIIEDEGNTTATASAAIVSLIEAGVDAIIGPSSSLAAIGALDDAVAAEVLTCSPTATAISLDDFPDNRLFFRTIASDSLQAVAIAEEAEQTGARNVAIVHVDDAYGRPYAAAVADALEGRPLTLADTISIPVDDETFDAAAIALVESEATVAIVLGAANDSARFLDALGRQAFGELSNIIMNDAIRDPAAEPLIEALPPVLRNRISGVAPQITVSGPTPALSAPFAPQVVDCMNLIALSAVQADSDLPTVIAGLMAPVSSGGLRCRSFADCAEELADDRQIDYNGPTGITELNREGETLEAVFDTFQFESDGTDVFVRSFTVRR
jgi:branched-chain amino acid transport system substrate-binding protein